MRSSDKSDQKYQAPIILTESKIKPFWREKSFYKDGNPIDIVEFSEKRLGLLPSPKQKEILYALAGKNPYDWDTGYQQYIIGVGQGGGKNTYVIAPYTVYTAYRIANMKDPWYYFSVLKGEGIDRSLPFELANSSMVNDKQAKNVHFRKVQSMIRRCKLEDGTNWFEKYSAMDIRESVGDIKGKEIHIKTQENCGDIIFHSFDSTVSAGEGLNSILDVIDEPSRANTQATYVKALELWNMYIGQLNTRFPRNIGKAVVFSYLNDSAWDLTWTLIQQTEEENKLNSNQKVMYAINLASWDTNPTVSKKDPAIAKAYRNNPNDARARYEGIKGVAKEGFYQPYPDKIVECFSDKIISPVEYEYCINERKVKHPSTLKIETKEFSAIRLKGVKGDNRTRAFWFDAAETYDGFVLKGGYIETIDELKDELFIDGKPEMIVVNKRPVIDIVFVWQPQEGRPVDFVNVGEVLGILLDKFPNTRIARSDKWNSVKLSQEIMSRGIFSETLGFGRTQQFRFYSRLRWMIFNNIPMFYKNPKPLTRRGITKTIGEWNIIEHEQLLRDGDKIDHPPQGSKDFADVDAGLCNDLISLETQQGAIVGANSLTDPKILSLIDQYIYERQKLRNASIPENMHLSLIAKGMGMSVGDTSKIKELIESQFPNL